MNSRPAYRDVLARVREFAQAQDTGFNIWKPRRELAGTLPGACYAGSTDTIPAFDAQVLRAVNALAADGTLIKAGKGRDALYWTPEAFQRRQDEAARAREEMAAKREAWRQVKMRLAGHHLLNISTSTLDARLPLEDWQALLNRLDALGLPGHH